MGRATLEQGLQLTWNASPGTLQKMLSDCPPATIPRRVASLRTRSCRCLGPRVLAANTSGMRQRKIEDKEDVQERSPSRLTGVDMGDARYTVLDALIAGHKIGGKDIHCCSDQ